MISSTLSMSLRDDNTLISKLSTCTSLGSSLEENKSRLSAEEAAYGVSLLSRWVRAGGAFPLGTGSEAGVSTKVGVRGSINAQVKVKRGDVLQAGYR